MMNDIVIHKARKNNLDGIDVSFPLRKLVAVAGANGSGKSTLLYDILAQYAYGSYLYAAGLTEDTAFFDTCDKIDGLEPVIAVQQNTICQTNPRSTVGTKTGAIYLLRQWYVDDGYMICAGCGQHLGGNYKCQACGYQSRRPSVRMLSPNSPQGMCLSCLGRGFETDVRLESIIPCQSEFLQDICNRLKIPTLKKSLNIFTKQYNLDPCSTRYDDLSGEQQTAFLYGCVNPELAYGRFFGVVNSVVSAYGKGILTIDCVERRYCSACGGSKLGGDARRLLIDGKNITELSDMPVEHLLSFLDAAGRYGKISRRAHPIVSELKRLLLHFIDIGIPYLSLNREIPSISGGEMQKLLIMSRLAAQSAEITFIFDEPFARLHETEKQIIVNRLKALRDKGNTVLVIEHDERFLRESDEIIIMGPNSGKGGGRLMYRGIPQELPAELSAIYKDIQKNYDTYVDRKENRLEDRSGARYIHLHGVKVNNLQNVSVDIPLGCIVGIAGVSGSGKSSLISGALASHLRYHFTQSSNLSDTDEEYECNLNSGWGEISGLDKLTGYSIANQSPIGKSSRSNIMTYLGIWDHIRDLYAKCAVSADAPWTASSFSFNASGACEACNGTGVLEFKTGALSSTSICNVCEGKRYKQDILNIHYRGKSIADVLDMDVNACKELFFDIPVITQVIDKVIEAGLGYLVCGQPTSTLSGGEAQRLKILRTLLKRRDGRVLLILDEAASGLSIDAIPILLNFAHSLVNAGHSLILIEHKIHVLAACDWLIELGPGSGGKGGTIIAQGTPKDLACNNDSIIGKYLMDSYQN